MSVFIIAEAGVNWRDLVDADDMIREASIAGADAIKFQCYKPNFINIGDMVINSNGDPVNGYTPNMRAEELNRIALDESTIRYLYWRCQQHGIEFMCTPMYPEAVAMLNPYVKRWKVRCADHYNADLTSEIFKTGKDVLMSCEDIPACADKMRIEKHVIFLYCQPEYPPKDGPTIMDILDFDGFSCHVPCWRWPELLKESMAEYLEVHVRLDKYEPHYCPIDTAVSITMSELKELCKRLK